MKHYTRQKTAVWLIVSSLALGACGKEDAQQQAGQMPPPPMVSVITVQPENVVLESNLPGRLEAVQTAKIVPQVSGIVKRRLFTEGSYVKAGQALYQLDDASYSANLESARAALMAAQAAFAKAGADWSRYRPLAEADAVSKQEWDAVVAAKRSAEAQVKSAQAAVRAAQVNVNHAYITAPISGVIGQSAVTEGALVNAGQTHMATIRQTDTLYVNIQQSSSDWLKLRRQLADGSRTQNSNIEVGIELEDGSEYPHKGRLLFVDAAVDESTGQVNVRAAVPNPENLLMSGMYVRVKLPLAGAPDAFVVPQRAVTRGKADTVLIVNQNNGMEPRIVEITGQKGSNWVIGKGLQAGDKVIVDGIMIAGMMGAKQVRTQEWQDPNMPAAPVQAAHSKADTDIRAASQAETDIQAASAAQ